MTQDSQPRGEIFVVDDDRAVRRALTALLSSAGYDVVCYPDGEALLAAARVKCPRCILLDVYIPGRSGLDILKQLHAEEYPAPIFMISGRGDIPMVVTAIRNGALDFIEKPFLGSEVLARIEEAIEAFDRRRSGKSSPQVSQYFPGCEPLSMRERDVLEQLAAGLSNKEAGRQLGVSPRTVEDHRANIMKKLGAKNALDLMRIVMAASESAA